MKPEGRSFIAGDAVAGAEEPFNARFPRTGEPVEPAYKTVSWAQLDRAVSAARSAFDDNPFDFDKRARLLTTIAERFVESGESLVERANLETGLGTERLTGELVRMIGQFEMMSDDAATSSRRGNITDNGEPSLLRTKVPLGVVAVFAASNFPLAFGVTGTDTASALAAGCTVVAKAHPSQPATAEICARVIASAIDEAGLPPGVFSVVHEAGVGRGVALVTDPRVDGVAFTGSFAGGTALLRATHERDRPIPIYAEMGSLNPVVVAKDAAKKRSSEIAEQLAGSYQLSAGQFCTKPGLVIVPDNADGRALHQALVDQLATAPSAPLLNSQMESRYQEAIESMSQTSGTIVHRAPSANHYPTPAVIEVEPSSVLTRSVVLDEIFGPVSVVTHMGMDQVRRLFREVLQPSLTATIYFEEDDSEGISELVELMARVAGRIVANGPPTGVRVSAAMHHGGPFPATTAPLHSSVGSTAIDRFLRPVTFQNFPNPTLPGWAARRVGRADNGGRHA